MFSRLERMKEQVMTALQDNGMSGPGGTKLALADTEPVAGKIEPEPVSLRHRLITEAAHQIDALLSDNAGPVQKFLVTIDRRGRFPTVSVQSELAMQRQFTE